MNGYYPEFVTGRKVGRQVPVFYFHHVHHELFEKQLIYLKENGYNTLNIKDLDALGGFDYPHEKKSVILTFDDGYTDLYDVAYPLLLSYHLKAVAFVSPYWMNKPGYITWEQTKEMEESGVVDIQSHSFSHMNVPVSSNVVDFVSHEISVEALKEVPFVDQKSGILPDQAPKSGMPVYEYTSGLSDAKRWISQDDLELFCQEFIKKNGRELFFEKSDWKRRLFEKVAEYQNIHKGNDVFETDEMHRKRVQFEIQQSKVMLENKLEPKKVSAFAFPRHAIGKIALSELDTVGFKYIFGGLIPLDKISKKKYKFYFLNRLNEDFFFRLPGKNRSSILQPFIKKAVSRS